MLQDYRQIRHYQAITDAIVDSWHRGYRQPEDMRLLLDGYLLALRTANLLEGYEIHRIEAEVQRFMRDPSNFEEPQPELLRGTY